MRHITTFLTASAVGMFCAGAAAQPAQTPPPNPPGQTTPNSDGWTMPPEGATHAASGTICANMVMGFDHVLFSGPMGSNLLGSCTYVDDTGNGDAGIRVRRYAPGAGESREEIDNDREVMEPGQFGRPMFAMRMAPVTTRDGTQGGRVTITKTRNGFLIDCFAEGISIQVASAKVALVCAN